MDEGESQVGISHSICLSRKINFIIKDINLLWVQINGAIGKIWHIGQLLKNGWGHLSQILGKPKVARMLYFVACWILCISRALYQSILLTNALCNYDPPEWMFREILATLYLQLWLTACWHHEYIYLRIYIRIVKMTITKIACQVLPRITSQCSFPD